MLYNVRIAGLFKHGSALAEGSRLILLNKILIFESRSASSKLIVWLEKFINPLFGIPMVALVIAVQSPSSNMFSNSEKLVVKLFLKLSQVGSTSILLIEKAESEPSLPKIPSHTLSLPYPLANIL